MGAQAQATILRRSLDLLAALGGPLSWALLAAAGVLLVVSVTPLRPSWRRPTLAALTGLLVAGELLLVWFHYRLWQASTLVDPRTGLITGHIAVPLWTESEKLYVWALIVAVMALLARRHAEDMLPYLGGFVAALTALAVLLGKPFTQPVPSFVGQLGAYLQAWGSGDVNAWWGLFQQMEGQRQYFYNTWYMWVHPPLLFFCYGAFVVSFAATVLMILNRSSAFETTAYHWARFGYLPLTAGMLLGLPWALLAWRGEAWWWSGKVNMSIMMWLLYTAYLHGRLYLRRKGMWRWVAVLAVLSFIALVLTYLTTYVIPGAHSVA